MPNYKVMVSWIQSEHVTVEADSLHAAVMHVRSLNREAIDRVIAPGAQQISVDLGMSYLDEEYDSDQVKAMVMEEQSNSVDLPF